jgi:hypothetical protein
MEKTDRAQPEKKPPPTEDTDPSETIDREAAREISDNDDLPA